MSKYRFSYDAWEGTINAMNDSFVARRSLQLALLCMCHHAAMTGSRAVLPLIALAHGAGQAAAGALVATQALVPALLALPLGALIAKRGVRWSVMLGVAGSASALILLSWASTVALLFVVASAVGAGYGLTLVSVQRELGRCVNAGDARAYDRFSLATAVSSSAGPLAAGALLAAAGAHWSLAGLGVLATAGLAAWSLGRVDDLSSEDAGRTRPAAAVGLLPRSVRPVLAAELVISLTWNAIAMLVILRGHAAGWSPADATTVLAVLGAGVAVARLASASLPRRVTDGFLIRASMVAAGLGVLSFVWLLPWWAVCAVQGLVGIGLGLSLSPVLSELHRRCGPASHTRVLSVRHLMLNACAVVAPAAVGVVASGACLAWLCVTVGVAAFTAAWLLRI